MRQNFCRKRQLRKNGIASPVRCCSLAVKDFFEGCELCSINLRRIDRDNGSRLESRDIDRSAGEFPRELDCFRRIIDGAVCTLGSGSKAAIDQVQLIAMAVAFGIVTDTSTISSLIG